MALGKRLKEARIAAGLSQGELAARVGMTQAAIAALEKRDSQQSTKAFHIAAALNVSLTWLLSGEEPGASEQQSSYFSHLDAWHSEDPLGDDEVELPLLREVELASGSSQVIEDQRARLRFAKATLQRADVPAQSAVCIFVRGNSMAPVMPDGTCVAVNKTDKLIREGEIYAIDHDGMLRVKYLHRRPGGGVRIVSQNSTEHPAEEVTPEELALRVRVIGRVFWWSVLR